MKKIILLILIINELQAVGPKKFTKVGWDYCRERLSHPGQQCCYSVANNPLEITALGAVNSNLTEIIGYGSDCRTTCECNTILPEIKCTLAKECVEKVGPYFICNKGHCKFRCLTNDDCAIKFGKNYICSNKFCQIKEKHN